SVVSDVPGTTRDSIDSLLEINGRTVRLIDTAGIRRRGKIEVGVEKYSVLRSVRAVNRSDVVILVLDATELATAQDAHVAAYANDAKKGIVIAVNKWDLIEKDSHTIYGFTARVREALKFLPDPPIVFISALTGQRATRVVEEALVVFDERQKRVPTGQLNQTLQAAFAEHPPGMMRGRRLKLLYATQPGINPPTFVLFVNDPKLLHFSYQRYLENRLREAFGFQGTPIDMVFRMRSKDDEP
ncbi:MAG: GTP-binding protein, partial [Dehalococcoidia bacterium]|nr:GTP-binding protein [Dehalococcoidia bacterium]